MTRLTRPTNASDQSRETPRFFNGSVLKPVDRLGQWALQRGGLVLETGGLLITILVAAVRPRTWRRPVRRELIRQVYQVGVSAVPSFIVLGVLVGGAMVYQAVFWLEAVGEIDLVAQLLVRTLVQELAPVLVAVILLGRSGIVMTAEVMRLRADGQVKALNAMGLPTTSHLLMPRVLGLIIAAVALTVLFTMVALVSGFALANVVGVGRANLLESLDTILARIDPRVYGAVLFKTGLAGGLIGTICVRDALGASVDQGRLAVLSRSFMESLLVIFLIAGAVSLLL
jgi:phospholipid/cholesterol/gamma-HCH transport system permease protein